jgi:hypothetical protein
MESVSHIRAAEDEKTQKERGGGNQGENNQWTLHR